MASLASGPPWTVTSPNGDRAEADDLDSALTAARTLELDGSTHYGVSTVIRAGLTLYRNGLRHNLATMLAREGFARNPLGTGKEQE